jgi:hypothetical protein
MNMKSAIALASTVLILNSMVFAAEKPAQPANIYTPAFKELKKLNGVYEAGISDQELAKRERENVVANREALIQLRILLENSLQGFPAPHYDSADESQYNSAISANLREFARLLIRESNVRLADGDVVGAMQSRLDCYRLAANISRNGMIIDGLNSVAAEAIAWSNIDKVGSQLSGESCIEFFNQIEATKRKRATYIDLLQKEKASVLLQAQKQHELITHQYMAASPEELARAKKEIEKDGELSPEEKKEMLAFSPENMMANLIESFDDVIASAKQPFSIHAEPIKSKDVFSRSIIASVSQKRFHFERSEVTTNLLQAALLLRARQLGTISEAEFERLLPHDPFSTSRLKVKDAYVYSVGPDGEDNGGEPFKNVLRRDIKTGEQTQAKSNSLQKDSVGDVIGPNFLPEIK